MAIKAAHGFQDFLSQVKGLSGKNGDFARSNRFEAVFSLPNCMSSHRVSGGETRRLISLFVEDAIIPGTLVGTRPFRINNLNEQRANVIDFGGDSISFTFLIDTTWSAKDFFGDWMRNMIDPVSRYVIYPSEYYSTIDLYALNSRDERIVHWKIIDAFPRSVAPVSVSSTNAQVLRLPVTFAYKKWQVISAYTPAGTEYSTTSQDPTTIDPEFGYDESANFGEDFDGQDLYFDDTTGDLTEFEDT
jgi:hypothetical protein